MTTPTPDAARLTAKIAVTTARDHLADAADEIAEALAAAEHHYGPTSRQAQTLAKVAALIKDAEAMNATARTMLAVPARQAVPKK